MRGFRYESGGYRAELDAGEREVVASVVANVVELLGGELPDLADGSPDRAAEATGRSVPSVAPVWRLRTEPVPPPDDPAVHRLLPDASQDDPAVAAEFRRLTEDDLRTAKLARLRWLWTALQDDGPVVPAPQAPAVAATLTDLRLVLAERLGIRTDEDADRLLRAAGRRRRHGADDVRAYLVTVYDALTWLQESLVQAMLARGDLGPPGRVGPGD
ncbi:DUF2017 family protein [Cellulomonas sp. NTE-D12]|uniref:DUF2017 family protein n=1 Tax=Cellulomonas sp. NTE-D12 TaxID=2962632 RepID=UPI003081B164|nr:hypothetical protein CELD12_12250 [Cellulomonas sp. NTE-D12]